MLYADDNVLVAESGDELDRMMGQFDYVSRRRILKVNMSKSKLWFLKEKGCHTVVSV